MFIVTPRLPVDRIEAEDIQPESPNKKQTLVWCVVGLHVQCLEEVVSLRLVHAEQPPLTSDGAGAAHGIERRPLLVHDARVHRDHGPTAWPDACSPAI